MSDSIGAGSCTSLSAVGNDLQLSQTCDSRSLPALKVTREIAKPQTPESADCSGAFMASMMVREPAMARTVSPFAPSMVYRHRFQRVATNYLSVWASGKPMMTSSGAHTRRVIVKTRRNTREQSASLEKNQARRRRGRMPDNSDDQRHVGDA